MTADYDYLFDCFARHILDAYKTPEARRSYLDKQEARKGKAFADKLRDKVMAEFERRDK